jgi:uncharacterized protein
MHRIVATCLALWMVVAIGGGTARADTPRRVALIIANADYVNGGPLKNPVSDATLIAAALKKAGFQVVDVEANLGTGAFNHALRAFGEQAAGADAAVIYYAGHGIEAQGTNWLLPVDVTLDAPRDLDYEAISIDKVLAATEGARMRMVVLDACRDNPFAKSRSWSGATRGGGQGGLAEVKADDVLVIYSAAPGEKALDGSGVYSPFAQSLAQRLPEPGMEIHLLGSKVRDDVLRMTGEHQRPYVSLSISGDAFFFVGGVNLNVTRGPAQPPPQVLAFDVRQVDMALWTSVGSSNDVAQLNAYLGQFPNGMFAEAARAKIAALNRSAVTISPTLPPTNSVPVPQSAAKAAIAHISSADWTTSPGRDVLRRVLNQASITDVEALAQADDPRAQALMGWAFDYGDGGKVKDFTQAMAWSVKAANHGDPSGQELVGNLYATGRGVERDDAQAMAWYRKAADQGRAAAQSGIGYLYERAQDYVQAMAWYRKAADQGFAMAQNNIGFFYDTGKGVAQDSAQAMVWFRKAAAQGDAGAQSNIGDLYAHGRGVEQDYAQAMAWFRKAADHGHATAQRNIGDFYAAGRGVDRDDVQARVWFEKAAASGDREAQQWLATHAKE